MSDDRQAENTDREEIRLESLRMALSSNAAAGGGLDARSIVSEAKIFEAYISGDTEPRP